MELTGRRIVVLSYPDYQELDLWFAVLRVREAGGEAHIAGPDATVVESTLGYPALGDVDAATLDLSGVDAFVLPSASSSPKLSDAQRDLLARAVAAGTPVVAIGNGADALGTDGSAPTVARLANTDQLPDLLPTLVRALSAT